MAQDEAEARARQGEQWIGVGESVVGFFMGRRSSRAVSSVASKWNRAGAAAADVEESKQTIAKLQAEQQALEAELKAQVDEITANWEQALANTVTDEIAPRRTDVDIKATGVGWLPLWRIRYDDGRLEQTETVPAYEAARRHASALSSGKPPSLPDGPA